MPHMHEKCLCVHKIRPVWPYISQAYDLYQGTSPTSRYNGQALSSREGLLGVTRQAQNGRLTAHLTILGNCAISMTRQRVKMARLRVVPMANRKTTRLTRVEIDPRSISPAPRAMYVIACYRMHGKTCG